MNKFRKEKHISQICQNGIWSFRVRFNGHSKTFTQSNKLSPSMTFKMAVNYRDSLLLEDRIDKPITVRECFNQITDIYVIRVETLRKLTIYFNKYIHEKDKELSQVTRYDIINDLNSMVASSSDDTIQRVLSIWKKIYGVGIAKEYISTDLTLHIQCPRSHLKATSKRNELVTINCIEDLIKAISKSQMSHNDKIVIPLMLQTLFLTGMRPSECFALEKADVDFKKRTITINKEVGSDLENNWIIRQCKTKESNRVVPISDKLLPILKEVSEIKGTYLFPNKDSYYNNTLGDRLHKLAKKNGYDFHLYQCRHTFITTLFMNGVDLKTIQELVGQKINATTIGYVVSDDIKKKNAINVI